MHRWRPRWRGTRQLKPLEWDVAGANHRVSPALSRQSPLEEVVAKDTPDEEEPARYIMHRCNSIVAVWSCESGIEDDFPGIGLSSSSSRLEAYARCLHALLGYRGAPKNAYIILRIGVPLTLQTSQVLTAQLSKYRAPSSARGGSPGLISCRKWRSRTTRRISPPEQMQRKRAARVAKAGRRRHPCRSADDE